MKAGTISFIIVLLAACGQPKDEKKPRLSDAQFERLRQGEPGMTDACLEMARYGGIEALPEETDACFRMTPPMKWRGLWTTGMEFSRFCPAPARECSFESPGEQIWLSGSSSVDLPQYEGQSVDPVYEVEFIGRKTTDRGDFGHFGMSDYEIIVDRMISMRPIQQPSGNRRKVVR